MPSCYAVGAKKALIYRAYRTQNRGSKEKIPYPSKSAFYCATNLKQRSDEAIAAEVGQTPQGWNAGIFSMIQGLSENVIVPIAGLVITYVLCVELISMVTEKNNMHDIDTFMFFKWFFKAWVAVYLVTHTFTITMAAVSYTHLTLPTNREV